jgi:hypothetical protein
MPDLYNIGKNTAILVAASPESQKRLSNGHGGKVFYKNASTVSTSDTEVAVGASVGYFSEPLWFISETETQVIVETKTAPTFPEITVSGASNFTGGVKPLSGPQGIFAGNWNPVAATSGTDTTPAEKKLFVTSFFLPANKKIKGIGYLVGSVGGTNKAVAGLFNSSGTLLGHSSETTEGTTVGTAAEMQELNLTAEYSAIGPAQYFIGITMNGGTARLRTIPKNTAGSNILSEEITIAAKNVLANITVPTAFTADRGPVGWVY